MSTSDSTHSIPPVSQFFYTAIFSIKLNRLHFIRFFSAQLEPERACREYEGLLREFPADLCVLGIGENGHLAFNDPPYADFRDPTWVKMVRLAEASRAQQVGEGHFASITEVPTLAISLTIPALLAAGQILAVVPEARKARAVYQALRAPVNTDCPASVLRHAPNAILFLDVHSAAQAFPEVVR